MRTGGVAYMLREGMSLPFSGDLFTVWYLWKSVMSENRQSDGRDVVHENTFSER